MFDVTFPDGIRRGMAFDSPTHPKVFVTKNGSTISKKDWKRLKLLAADDLPDSIRAPHVPTASDEVEHRVGMLRHTLRGYGLDDDSIDEACEICRRELAGEPVEDELPTSGPGGARNLSNSQSREGGEKHFRSPGRFESRPPLGTTSSSKERSMLGEATYRASPASDASLKSDRPWARVGIGYGSSQFDPANPPPPRSKRATRQAYDGADGKAREHLEDLLGFKLPEVGPWPSRR